MQIEDLSLSPAVECPWNNLEIIKEVDEAIVIDSMSLKNRQKVSADNTVEVGS